MKEEKYDSEDLFQSLLEDYPKLISGSQINPDAPRRWILVKREMGIRDKENGSNRWSVDHFFLDQDGIPTLIEVKRSTDTRIRREVVGQMLDYATNSIKYWNIDEIRELFEQTCSEKNIDHISHLADILDKDADQEEYWKMVERNLKNSNIRLLFVADIIPPELQRIIEFLNEQMISAEVLAMEVKQYSGQNLKTLVSRVVGRTMKAADLKAETKGKWNKEQLLEEVKVKSGANASLFVKGVIDWCNDKGYITRYGKGATPSLNIGFFQGDTECKFFELDPKYIRISFSVAQKCKPFNDVEKRRELILMLNSFEGFTFNEESPKGSPGIQISQLSADKSFDGFCETFEWIVRQVRENN
ncbi:hypothetical protein F1737_09760 [Methanoplanus sp. FWC-SCC4]|uniref:Uncharacterized protein n=1 Tax=Methanochimaera problematica TaxID=2609417 RepID=A0AA97I340_9EURY|nr:hypothetical protein [Methanoplanus sp. FWC-SCC4]WOF16950.1 hypothetical protein F1737_09760 [Methanoplanus sp. FWC-SCC4]